MTNILCAAYPDLWNAATVYSGAAAGCFVNTSTAFGSYCTVDDLIMDGDYWSGIVHAMNPGTSTFFPHFFLLFKKDQVIPAPTHRFRYGTAKPTSSTSSG